MQNVAGRVISPEILAETELMRGCARVKRNSQDAGNSVARCRRIWVLQLISYRQSSAPQPRLATVPTPGMAAEPYGSGHLTFLQQGSIGL